MAQTSMYGPIMLENLQVVKSETIDEVDRVSKVRGPHSLHINDDCFQTPSSLSQQRRYARKYSMSGDVKSVNMS